MDTFIGDISMMNTSFLFSENYGQDAPGHIVVDTIASVQRPHTKKFHTSREWDDQKDIIRELYMEREMSLADLREYMAKERSFYAQPHEYKFRLRRWGFKRSYTYQQKEHISQLMAAPDALSTDIAQLTMNGKPIAHDKILRHRRQTKKIAATAVVAVSRCRSCHLSTRLCECRVPYNVDDALFDSQTDHGRTCFQPEILFPTNLPSFDLDNGFWISMTTAENYLRIMHSELGIDRHQVYRPILLLGASFGLVAFEGLVHLVAGPAELGRRVLDLLCAAVPKLIVEHPMSLSAIVTFIQRIPLWKAFPDVHQVLTTFFYQQSCTVLGSDHSSSMLLKLACNFKETYDVAHNVQGTILSLVREFDIQKADIDASGALSNTLFLLEEQWDEAEAAIQEMLNTAVPIHNRFRSERMKATWVENFGHSWHPAFDSMSDEDTNRLTDFMEELDDIA